MIIFILLTIISPFVPYCTLVQNHLWFAILFNVILVVFYAIAIVHVANVVIHDVDDD